MQPFQVLEVVLLDLRDLVVLQVQQGGVVWDLCGNSLQSWWRNFLGEIV